MSVLCKIIKPKNDGKHLHTQELEEAKRRAVDIERRVAYLEAQARLMRELHNLSEVEDGNSARA